jgi:ribulose-phosphate 3-epimerase
MIIIPTSELQKDFFEAEKRISLLKNYSRWIQIDVCDNEFTPGKTFELELLNKLNFNTDNLLWDIHLMVKEPQDWIEKCLFIGANRIIGQVEMMADRELFVKTIKDEGLEVGLAFDVETPIENIPEETDEILLMGRKAGFGELPFEEKVYKKVETLRKINEKREKKFLIAVDGGVDEGNIGKLEKLGVEIVYSGNNFLKLINAD